MRGLETGLNGAGNRLSGGWKHVFRELETGLGGLETGLEGKVLDFFQVPTSTQNWGLACLQNILNAVLHFDLIIHLIFVNKGNTVCEGIEKPCMIGPHYHSLRERRD